VPPTTSSIATPSHLSASTGSSSGGGNTVEAARYARRIAAMEQRYQQSLATMKGSYAERLKRLAEQLSGMVNNASGDAVLLAMAHDPASLQYVQPRLLEMLEASITLGMSISLCRIHVCYHSISFMC
jgi:hypothetical protein